MNVEIKISEKQTYRKPLIERVKLDNEMSLVLQSTEAPDDPESSLTPEYFNNDPFKTNIG